MSYPVDSTIQGLNNHDQGSQYIAIDNWHEFTKKAKYNYNNIIVDILNEK